MHDACFVMHHDAGWESGMTRITHCHLLDDLLCRVTDAITNAHTNNSFEFSSPLYPLYSTSVIKNAPRTTENLTEKRGEIA